MLDWLQLVGQATDDTAVRRRGLRRPQQRVRPVQRRPLRGLIWLAPFLPAAPGDRPACSARWSRPRCARSPGSARATRRSPTPPCTRCRGSTSDAALAQIARLAARVTYKGTLKELNAALDARAAALGPDPGRGRGAGRAGLRADRGRAGASTLRRRVGADWTSTARTVAVAWRNGAGKAVKSRARLGAGRPRRGAARSSRPRSRTSRRCSPPRPTGWTGSSSPSGPGRSPPGASRYLDHPLVGTLARRLIWLVGDAAVRATPTAPCASLDDSADRGRTTTRCGCGTRSAATSTRWSPGGLAGAARVTQPFKQAHREVYLLTAAEEHTGVYSNRFAAHIAAPAPVPRPRRGPGLAQPAAADGRRRRTRRPPGSCRSGGCAPSSGSRAIGDDYGTDTTESGSVPAARHRPGAVLPDRRARELRARRRRRLRAVGAPGRRADRPAAAGRDPAAGPQRGAARRGPVRRRRQRRQRPDLAGRRPRAAGSGSTGPPTASAT